jgi:hypothetical protein
MPGVPIRPGCGEFCGCPTVVCVIKTTNRTKGEKSRLIKTVISPEDFRSPLVRHDTMSPSVSREPPSAEWQDLLNQLPIFPPAPLPPPTLFPLLSPLLRQKLGLLSLGRGRGWPGTLTWLPPDLSYKVNERLKSAWRHQGLNEKFLGYRRFDEETVCPRTLFPVPDFRLSQTLP